MDAGRFCILNKVNTKGSDVIFYQIDRKGRCRTGKVMKYYPYTGHRYIPQKHHTEMLARIEDLDLEVFVVTGFYRGA